MHTKEEIQLIIDEIKANLTDDLSANCRYIMSKIKYYRELDNSFDIVAAIYKYFTEYISHEDKDKLNKLINEGIKKRRIDHQKAVEQIKCKNYNEAILILEHLLETFPFTRGKRVTGYSFAKPFEAVIHATKFKPKYPIFQYEEPVCVYYYQLAYCHMMNKEFKLSKEAIDKACKCDPVSFEFIFFKAGLCEENNDQNNLRSTVIEALEYAYTVDDFAKAYYLLGLSFAKNNDDLVAFACLTLSCHFRKTKYNMVLRDLLAKKCIVSLENDPVKICDILMTENIPFGPSQTIINAFDDPYFKKIQSLNDSIKKELDNIKNTILNDDFFMLSASTDQIQ